MRRLVVVNLTACGLLLIQYLLGMVVNTFIVLPAKHPGASASNYFGGAISGISWAIASGPAWVAAHAAFGLALVVAAIASVARTWRGGNRLLRTLSVVGALAIIGAGFNGVSFLNYGQGFSSMIMAGLWLLALACYGTGAFLALPGYVAADLKGRKNARSSSA